MVEQLTFNQLVVGSIPTPLTILSFGAAGLRDPDLRMTPSHKALAPDNGAFLP